MYNISYIYYKMVFEPYNNIYNYLWLTHEYLQIHFPMGINKYE